VFSSRIPADRAPNALARAVAGLRAARIPYVDLTLSNPTLAGIDYPPGLLAALGDPRGLEYRPEPFGLADARAAVARDAVRRGSSVSPDDVVLSASTSEAYALLFKVLCDPGDVVLVPRPGYPLFEHLAGLEGVAVASFDLRYDARWRVDFDGLQKAAAIARARAVVVVSPNNPTGSCLTGDEIRRLGAFCAERGLALVGDEVFADYSWSGEPPPSVLSQDAALAFSLGGLSKSAGLPQLKLGWMIAGGPRDLVREALGRLEIACDAALSVATPVQHALPALLRDGAVVRDRIRARIATNLAALDSALRSRPSCRRLRADGGWSAVIQVPATRPDEELLLELLAEDRVLAHPGYFFDFEADGFVVVSLLPRPDDFTRGIGALLSRAAERR
jgi:aspartate/methionine/tyrosine aminotransferase